MILLFFRDLLWSIRDCKYTEQWLKKISQMGQTMEDGFNPDPTKQAQEVIFLRKSHSPKPLDL